MSYGLQVSASGLLSSLYRQDVFANNLANVESVGFKPDFPQAALRQPVREEDGVRFLPSDAMLERLGSGVWLMPNRTDFRQGTSRSTGRALDAAIEGKGFFVVRDQNDSTGDDKRLTRDGRFTRGLGGELVHAATGMAVLDDSDNTIVLRDAGDVTIDSDGTVRQDSRVLGRLAVVNADEDALQKAGSSLFRTGGSSLSRASGSVRQGFIEDSAVDEVRALLDMTGAAREVELNADLMRTHDRLSDRAIGSLVRPVA